MTQTLLSLAADLDTQLAAPVAIGDTTATLVSATDDDSVALPNGTYGFTIDSGNASKEYIVCTLTSTALTNIYSISRQGVATAGFVRAHRRGAKVVITDWAILSRMLKLLNGTTNFDSATPLGYDGAPAALTGNQWATVNYVLSVVTGGTVAFDQQVASNQIAGESLSVNDHIYFKVSDGKWWKVDADDTATFTQVRRGFSKTAASADGSITVAISGPVSDFSGLTVGKYYASNTAGAIQTSAGTNSVFVGFALTTTTLLLDTYTETLPSQKEKDAMSGGGDFGTPSSSNKFLTEDWDTANLKVVTRTYNLADSPATWTKAAGLVRIYVQAWGGGGSGGYSDGSYGAGGGGGGAYADSWFNASVLGATETVTIGAGGAAKATQGAGTAGGNTTFGSLLTAYGGGAGFGPTTTGTGGGGGGGGRSSAGASATTGTGAAGGNSIGEAGAGSGAAKIVAGGGGSDGTSSGSSNAAGGSYFNGGGGGGGSDSGNGGTGGSTYFGGGGGGGASNIAASPNTAGTSVMGGNGGLGRTASRVATAGTVPAGGGGGSINAASGAGAAGRVIVTEYYA